MRDPANKTGLQKCVLRMVHCMCVGHRRLLLISRCNRWSLDVPIRSFSTRSWESHSCTLTAESRWMVVVSSVRTIGCQSSPTGNNRQRRCKSDGQGRNLNIIPQLDSLCACEPRDYQTIDNNRRTASGHRQQVVDNCRTFGARQLCRERETETRQQPGPNVRGAV